MVVNVANALTDVVSNGVSKTVNDCVTSPAALKLLSPICVAVIEVMPIPLIVTVFPETLATEGFELVYMIANSEVAVPFNANGKSLATLFGSVLKVIVWFAFVMSAVIPFGCIKV